VLEILLDLITLMFTGPLSDLHRGVSHWAGGGRTSEAERNECGGLFEVLWEMVQA
jgi:hypothetical protein